MQFQSEILRFQEGARSHHPSPEATIVAARPGMLTDAGERIAVLVDLTPRLTYRSREIRTLTVKTYWASSGSIVARLRRALAAANRHLLHINSDAPPGSKCSGSITCAVFSNEELFLGQVGSAYAFVLHPPGVFPRFEVYPRRERLLVPLGATTPPVINVSYTVLEAGCSAFFATTLIAESQARELWQKVLALPTFADITNTISQEMLISKPSGSVILVKGLASSKIESKLTSAQLRRQRSEKTQPPSPIPESANQVSILSSHTQKREGRSSEQLLAASMRQISSSVRDNATTAISQPASINATVVPASSPAAVNQSSDAKAPRPVRSDSNAHSSARPTQAKPRPAVFATVTARIQHFFTAGRGRIQRFLHMLRKDSSHGSERETTVERTRLRKSLRSLLPGKVDGLTTPKIKKVPSERSPVLSGIVAGITFLVILISLSTYMQFGGPLKAAELLSEAQDLRANAYNTQNAEDWYQLHDLCSQIVRLDAQNIEAHNMKLEAEQAIDALENAALLSVTPLLELGTSPSPRHIVAGGSWVYVLNPATDDILGLPLDNDYVTSSATIPTVILKRGQSIDGKPVSHLVDLDWIEPGGVYRDGALFIYSDNGTLYIYEPTLGPNSTQSQKLQGDLSGVSVTGMGTFGTKLYFIHRQNNQILMYEPINGIYESPRLYFADGTERDMASVIDIAIDGRIYLLTGDGSLTTYFTGAQDLSFQITDLPDQDSFSPSVLAVESDPENGLVYLGDTRRERIVAFNKLGEFIHQFRMAGDELQHIEALTVMVSDDETTGKLTRILFYIAEDRLYASRLPEFLSP
ncbi:MAG: hypothetical protein P1S60_05090 [Anaerolineae bacterium]|nr:hypothetical protein [Anaerolineae bacterium]